MSALLFLLFSLTEFVNCDIVGRLSVKGIEHDLFVGTSDPKFIEMEDHGFTLHGGGNLSLFRAPIQNYSLDQAWPVSRPIFPICVRLHVTSF